MPEASENWEILSDDFPPTLNREANSTEISAGETPDAYQLNWDTPGLLAKIAAVPPKQTRIVDLVTPTPYGGETISSPMTWLYNRLVGIDDSDSTQLRFGSPDYRDQYFAQGKGLLNFIEDSAAIIAFRPVDPQGLVVIKNTTGAYFIPDFRRRDGRFEVGNINQTVEVTSANNVNSFENKIYFSNAQGVFAWDGKQLDELTLKIRNDLGSFVAQQIDFDYDKRLLIGTFSGADYAIDLNNGKLFDYGTSGFLYTSRTLVGPNKEPLSVDRIAFIIDHSDTTGGEFTFSVKIGEDPFGDDITVPVPYNDEDTHQRIEISLDDIFSARQWAMRITDLPTNIRIKQIQVNSTGYEAEDFSV